jgi:hypothetical protein
MLKDRLRVNKASSLFHLDSLRKTFQWVLELRSHQ